MGCIVVADFVVVGIVVVVVVVGICFGIVAVVVVGMESVAKLMEHKCS